MDFCGIMEEQREVQAKELGLDTTGFAFYSILKAELGADKAGGELDEILQQRVLRATKELVQMLHDAVHIIDFFRKWDEQKRVKRNIKRAILNEFDDLVFCHEYNGQRLGDTWWHKRFVKAIEAFGIDCKERNITGHSLRP